MFVVMIIIVLVVVIFIMFPLDKLYVIIKQHRYIKLYTLNPRPQLHKEITKFFFFK